MRVLVNALSVTNLSGRHVLLGHLQKVALWTRGEHEFDVLFHAHNRDVCRDMGENVRWVECPGLTADWLGRSAWEMTNLSRVASTLGSDFLFTPAGTIVPGLPLPQVVFAQNPWALVKNLQRTAIQNVKAVLQRSNYRRAVRESPLMFFNSDYMRTAYRENAGCIEIDSAVVYQALDDETHELARQMRSSSERNPLQIFSVSAMAPHKGVETLVQALAIVRERYEIPAQLVLAGAWPDRRYRKMIEALVSELGLQANVIFKGHVSEQELYQLYAESRVFALMSRCESFGIPAIEAQAFGTPVVSSNCCAIPEVCGRGGVFPEVGDVQGTADRIATLLSDELAWCQLSEAAIENSGKFRWNLCSQKLLRMFEVDFSR